MEIVKEDGKIWGIKKDFSNGVWHFTRYYLGEDKPEKKETPKKRTKKSEDV